MRKIVIILPIIIAAVLLLQIDDELNPEITDFVALAEPTKESDAYLYLMGMGAPEDTDPLVFGKQIFESIDQDENIFPESKGSETKSLNNIIDRNQLDLLANDIYRPDCGDTPCSKLDKAFSHQLNLAEILQTHSTLLNRYQTFIEMKDYQDLSKASINMWIADFQYLLHGNYLLTLKAVHLADTSEAIEGVALLSNNLSAQRHQLEKSDTVIGKVIYSALISQTLDALSLLIRQEEIPFNQTILPLSDAEQNFEKAIAREFTMGYNLYMALDKHPDFFNSFSFEESSDNWKAPGWLVRTVFKPNMTANMPYVEYKKTVAHSQLTPSQFATAIKMETENKSAPVSSLQNIRNFAGVALTGINLEMNFDEYVSFIFDLNAKIAIFNQTINEAELPKDLEHIQNPYYNKGGTAYYAEEGKQICLSGPIEEASNRRCLRVEI